MLGRESDVLMHNRPDQPPHALIFHIAAVEVNHVTPMLTVYAHRHASKHCRHLRGERREIARMHDLRTESVQECPDHDVEARHLTGRFVERVAPDVGAPDAQPEIGIVHDADDSVTVPAYG